MTKKLHSVEARREAEIASALETAADELERSAERLRKQAGLAWSSAANHEEWAELPGTMREIEADILAGKTEDEAIAAAVDGWYFVNSEDEPTERERWVRAGYYRAHFRDYAANSIEARRFIRNREILQLARTDSNAEIGARFKLHPNTISRIVQEALRGKRRRPSALARVTQQPTALPASQRAPLSHHDGETT